MGQRPNGLAFDAEKGILVSGNVGKPDEPQTYSLSVIDVNSEKRPETIPTPGRSRWTVFSKRNNKFYINIGTPSLIAAIDAKQPTIISHFIEIPAKGPHGMDIDEQTNTLFCACDEGVLVSIDLSTEKVIGQNELSGLPDVIFFNSEARELYVAIGEPGAIEVFDTRDLRSIKKIQYVQTELGAHTIGYVAASSEIYAFLPGSHKAMVFQSVTKNS